MKKKLFISIFVLFAFCFQQKSVAQQVFFADYDATSTGGTGNAAVGDHSGSLSVSNQFFSGRCGLATTPAVVSGRPGDGVIRFETRQSDGNYASTSGNRSELKYTNQALNNSNNTPTELWYAWSIYIPDPGTGISKWDGGDNAYASPQNAGDGGGREIYIQIHAPDGIDLNGNTENPPLAFYRSVDASKPNVGYFKFTWRWNNNASGESNSLPISIELGEWTDYVMRVVWSNSSSNDGAIEIWKNGVKVVSVLNTRVGYNNMAFSYFKQGIYAFDWNNGNTTPDAYNAVAYYDEVKLYQGSTTYDNMKPRRDTPAPDPIAPTAPSALVSSNVSDNSFSLTWTAGTDNVGVTGYEVYLNGVYKATLTGITGIVNGLTPSTTYEVTLVSKDAAGNSSPVSSSISVTTAVGCGAAIPWTSFPIATQGSTFTAEFDATPGSSNMDGLVGFSTSIPSASLYSLIACGVQFKTNIYARNAGAYAAENVLASTAGTKYHVRMVINVTTRKYDVFVTPQGGAEVVIGTNYSFRTEQASVTSLNYCSIITQTCDLKLENLVVAGTPISTGISHNNLTDIHHTIRLYPNPLAQNGELTIDFGAKLEKANVEIVDINGKLFYNRSIENASKMDLITNGVLNKGFYIVKVSDGQNSINQKLIVK